MKITLVKMKNEDIKDFQLFIRKYRKRKNHKKKHIFGTNSKVLRWYYKNSKNFNFFLAKIKKKIVGIQGFEPLNKFDRRLKNNQLFLHLWIAAKNSFPGVGLVIFRKIINTFKPEFVASIGVSKNVIPYNKWLGFEVKKMNHFVFFSPFIKKFRICNFKHSGKKIKIKNTNLNFIKVNSKNIHNLINKKIYSFQNPLKSNYYLINRYLKNPFYSYKLYLVKKNHDQQALVIFRFVEHSKSKAIRIVDYVGKNENFKLLYHLTIDLLQKSKAEFADIYSCGIPDKNLESAGFINKEKIKNLILPNNYEPFEFRNMDIYCAYKSAIPKKNIRLFRGDADGDRVSQVK